VTAETPDWNAPWAAPPWPAPPRPPRHPGRAAAAFVGIALAVGVLGAPLGLLWAWVAPSVPVRMTSDGAVLVDAQPEEFIAADGWFALLGLGFGALAAIGVWLVVRRRRGPLALLAVTVGAVGAGLLAWWLGRQVGLADYERLLDTAPVGAVFGKPPDLRAAEADLLFGFLPVARGDVLVPAFGAAVAYTLLAGWSRYPSLRRHEERLGADGFMPLGPPSAHPLSWDSSATPAPPAAPAPPVPGEAAPPRD
jgi:hypothetical protein